MNDPRLKTCAEQFERLLARIETRTAKIGVIGLGYVGLPLAVAVASNNYPVFGFDIDESKIRDLKNNESYINAVSNDALSQVAETAEFTEDFSLLSKCDVIVICVPTPLTKHREPDLTYVESTTRTLAKHMRSGSLVILESTTFPGTTREVLVPILEESGLKHETDFWVGFSPEREDPGNATYRTETIPKIVGGDSEHARQLAQSFYGNVVDAIVPVSSTATAEAIKITENVFRAVNIALVNELKVIYSSMGIDIWEVIDGAATKPFGFMPFYPGPGLGGHCIPIDPFYLTWKAREHGHFTRFIELAGEINVRMPEYVISRLREALDKEHGLGLSQSRILIVGLSYKKNVPDMRESPSVRLLDMMLQQGADVDFLDPLVQEVPRMREYPHLVGLRSVNENSIRKKGYHAVLIATDHDMISYRALADLDVPVVDTRNVFAKRGLPMDKVTKA